MKSIKNFDVPKSGYYLFKILTNSRRENLRDIRFLRIAAIFGHKRALYEYGYLLYKGNCECIPMNKQEGIEYIKQAAYLNYRKAIKFCVSNEIHYQKDKDAFDIKNQSGIIKEDKNFYLIDIDEDEKNSDSIKSEDDVSFDSLDLISFSS